MKKIIHTLRISTLVCILFTQSIFADEKIKPYIMASATDASVEALIPMLEGAGFQLVGQYEPYQGAVVMAFTNELLQTIASKSVHGGFGSAIRFSITETDEGTQLAYTNPAYVSAVYRMESLAQISESLEKALGIGTPFGSEDGLKPSKLRKYHYMMAMPYFDDVDMLAEHASYSDALASVRKNLAAGTANTVMVYEVSLPDKEETLIGVGILKGDGSDQVVMDNADLADMKHTAHLPYEILISKNKVIALRGRFRIAQSFPDLTMGTFMKIRSAPGAIKSTLSAVAQP